MATLNVVFTGPEGAENAIQEFGNNTGFYQGGQPDFTTVTATRIGTDYVLFVQNSGTNKPLWPKTFSMNKSDSNPTNVLGSYSGPDGTAVVSD